jgi:hypothetical protein
VRYGTEGDLDVETAYDDSPVTEHSVLVWPVAPRIDYTFVVLSACGCDTTVCAPQVFRSVPPMGSEPVMIPVEIIKVDVDPGDTSVEVTWASDRPCSSWVEVGTGTLYEQAVPGVPLGESVYAAEVGGLQPGMTYHLRVGAWDAAGGETAGDDLTFDTTVPTDYDPPSAPTGLRCAATEGGVSAWWNPSSEADLLGYNVYRARYRDGDLDWSRAVMLTEIPISEPSFFDDTTEPGAAYEYAVTAVDRSGNESQYSQSVSVVVPEGTSALSLVAYPNPMAREANLAFVLPPDAERARLRIVSVTGRVVLDTDVSGCGGSRGSDRVLVWNGRDSAGWPVGDGVYMCELVSGPDVARQKLTVVR